MKKFASRYVGLLTLLGIAAWSQPGVADPTTSNLDPLYAFCYGGSNCANNGTITPAAPSNPLQFGFYISPGPNTGDFSVEILIPTNEAAATPSSVSYSLTGTQGGPADNTSFSTTATLVSTKAWKGGGLSTYLGLTLAPTAPTDGFTNWLPLTQGYDAGATAYYVYEADLGTNELQAAKNDLLGPLLSLDQLLPEGALIVGELDTPVGTITTTRAGALLMDQPPVITNAPAAVPEPGALAIFGAALLVLAGAHRWKRG